VRECPNGDLHYTRRRRRRRKETSTIAATETSRPLAQ
jgi:hypothetical protein